MDVTIGGTWAMLTSHISEEAADAIIARLSKLVLDLFELFRLGIDVFHGNVDREDKYPSLC